MTVLQGAEVQRFRRVFNFNLPEDAVTPPAAVTVAESREPQAVEGPGVVKGIIAHGLGFVGINFEPSEKV